MLRMRAFSIRGIGILLIVLTLAIVLYGCSSKPKTTPTPNPERQSTAVRTEAAENGGETPVAIAPGGGGSPTPLAGEGLQATPSVTTDGGGETPAASPTAPVLTATPTPANCLNQAVFVEDITVPDGTVIRPDEKFVKTWKVQNSGTCDWGEGYTMAFAGGDIMSGALNQPIQPIKAGEIGEVSVELTSPTRGGRQTGYWVFQDPAGRRFGLGITALDMLWVQINVTFVDQAGNPGLIPVSFEPAPEGGEAQGDAAEGNVIDLDNTSDEGSSGEASPPESSEESDSGEGSEGQSGNCKYTPNNGYVNTLLKLINQARQQNGLSPVFLQDQLSAAALKHSADMGCNRFVDHNGSDGSTWYDRVGAQGYSAPMSARENIYVGDPTFGGDANGAFNWWMGSQVHRDNILFTNVTECGIAYVYVSGSPYGGYYTLVLGKR